MKICNKCKIEQDSSCFHKDKSKCDGLHTVCKLCRLNHYKQKYEFDINTKNRINIYQNNYYQNNKENILVVHKKYSIKKIEKIREDKRIYSLNKCKIDINFKLSKNLRSRLWHALKGLVKCGSSVSDLGCSVEELKVYLESKFECGMSWDNYGKGQGRWSIDHIEPLCSFDLQDKEQFLRACNYRNLKPIWDTENSKKGASSDRKRKKRMEVDRSRK